LTFTNQNNYELYDELLSYNFIDVDKANSYNEIIEKNIDKNNPKDELLDVIEENEMDKQKSQTDNKCGSSLKNNSKIKNLKKRCCCFC
jgi:hypothetical protein